MTTSPPTHPSTTTTEVVLPGIVEPDGLQLRDRVLPPPAPGQARVSVSATGISFAEQQMRRGKYYDQPPFPFVPGYDLVGTIAAVGPGVDPTRVGQRVAAVTKTGAWATEALLDAADLVPIPDGVDAAEAVTLLVNGVTAWRMLYRVAEARPGQKILVLGANGGVGTTLLQLADRDGIRVIGAASPRHHDRVRGLGAEPVDSRSPDWPAQVRRLAPEGVDAVFDHIGGPGIVDSYRLLGRGGTLVSYGSAATKNDPGSSQRPIVALIGRLMLWNLLPNGRRAHFFNFWAGRRRLRAYRVALADDLTRVLTLLRDGELTGLVAARFPLTEVSRALQLAESGTVTGKVVLLPHPTPVD